MLSRRFIRFIEFLKPTSVALISKGLADGDIDAFLAGFPCLDVKTVKRSSGHTGQKAHNHDLVYEGRSRHAQTLPASG